MSRKFIKFALGLLLFVLLWSYISNSFDGDLGWHLRFGRDAFNHNFQYQDSYTWSYLGQNWVNHEWGGDLLFWWLDSNVGYYALVMLVTSALFLAFYLATKIPGGRTTIAGLVIAIIAAHATAHILVMRLAMFSSLFFVVIWYSLEKIPDRRFYYWWPLLIWLWSVLHGSWILAFIVINIYWFGNIGQIIIHHFFQKFDDSTWVRADFIRVLVAEFLSLLAVAANPYGFKILFEVGSYFSQSFYKQHITEWLPSYSFPVYWGSLALSTVILFLALLVAFKKKINLPRLLLVVALFMSGFLYKRNVVFILLVGIPLLSAVAEHMMAELKKIDFISKYLVDKPSQFIVRTIGVTMIVMLLVLFGSRVKIYNDIWDQKSIIAANAMPYDAVEFLNQRLLGRSVKIFNNFNWGGYLNWKMPNSLIFLDGRSAATWIDPADQGQTMLQKYFQLRNDPGGLSEIEKNGVGYIILADRNISFYSRPDWVNRIIFGNAIDVLFKPFTPELEKDLDKSQNWKIIYNDGRVDIWEKK